MYKLYLYLDSPNFELRNEYMNRITNHNNKIRENKYSDSGFDILMPSNIELYSNESVLIDLKIKGVMKKIINNIEVPSAYYVYPRSSISKTAMRLANNVGIIDSGYRGNLKAAFDVLPSKDVKEQTILAKQRLLQICSPTLEPFYVEYVENIDDLDMETERGDGGFGSTGV